MKNSQQYGRPLFDKSYWHNITWVGLMSTPLDLLWLNNGPILGKLTNKSQ